MNDDNRYHAENGSSKSLITAERNNILSLSPKEALDAIIDSPRSMDLVQSFPEEDLYLLIHEIGVEDSLPLLPMASDDQWTYILDMEVWEQDRMEITSLTHWLNYLLNADPDRFVGRFFDDHLQDMELYLYKNIQVVIREHDQDPSELGEDYMTIDDVFYFKFIDDPESPESDDPENENRKDFLLRFLKRLAEYDHIRYHNILQEAATILPAENEEESFRLRNVRLSEKGFLPYDEAIGVYQPLSPSEMEHMSSKRGIGSAELKGDYEIPFYPIKLIQKSGWFTEALSKIEADELLQQIQAEFAGLSNQVISADKLKIKSREQLDHAVKKVLGYIDIGLEEFILKKDKADIDQAVHLITTYPLSHIFRIGYGLALALKWKAQRWHEKSWAVKNRLPLSFWGEEWLGVLGGLLIKKPLFYDNYQTGVLYREFSSSSDIKKSEAILNEIIAFDGLLSHLLLPATKLSSIKYLTYKNLVLTQWARHYLGLSSESLFITLKECRLFFNDLWSKEHSVPVIRTFMKTSFLNWISDATGLTRMEITGQSGSTLDRLFEEIEDEYGRVANRDLDPKHMYHFLLR